jgi:putative endonuclease
MQSWLVYIIEASDGSLYTGITTDIERRWREHSNGKGARYFWGRSPSNLAYVEACQDRSGASRREAAIKQLTRKQKQLLIQSGANALDCSFLKGKKRESSFE